MNSIMPETCTHCLLPFLPQEVKRVVVEVARGGDRLRVHHHYCPECLRWYEETWGDPNELDQPEQEEVPRV